MSPIWPLTMTCLTKGAWALVVPADSCRPTGTDCRLKLTVCGWMLTLVVPCNPPLSVATSWISR